MKLRICAWLVISALLITYCNAAEIGGDSPLPTPTRGERASLWEAEEIIAAARKLKNDGNFSLSQKYYSVASSVLLDVRALSKIAADKERARVVGREVDEAILELDGKLLAARVTTDKTTLLMESAKKHRDKNELDLAENEYSQAATLLRNAIGEADEYRRNELKIRLSQVEQDLTNIRRDRAAKVERDKLAASEKAKTVKGVEASRTDSGSPPSGSATKSDHGETLMYLLAAVAVIGLILFGRWIERTRCPNCKRHLARHEDSRVILGSGLENRTVTEEHRDTSGKVFATTDRNTVVARNLIQQNFHCKKCQYAWFEQEWQDA